MFEYLLYGLAIYIGVFIRTNLGFWSGLIGIILMIFARDETVTNPGWFWFFAVLCLLIMFGTHAADVIRREEAKQAGQGR